MAAATLVGFLQRLKQAMAVESLAALSDHELVEQFLTNRDEETFRAILQRHGPMVFRVCQRVLPREQDAEDAFQATFLVLAREARTIRRQASLASWLHGVAYRVALKARTAAARRRECHAPGEGSARPAQLPDEVSWKELRSLLDEELARLPEKMRAPLVLCYLQGLTQDEAAHQLGWSKITCRRNLERGRALLGTRLARRGVTLSAVLFAPLLSECTALAALPPTLLESTGKAVTALAEGKATVLAVGSARALALADGLVPSALVGKRNLLIGLFLAVLVAGIGGATLTRDPRPEQSPTPNVQSEENASLARAEPVANREEDLPDIASRIGSKFPTLILEPEVQAELRLREDQIRQIREVIQEVHRQHQEDFDTLRERTANRLRANQALEAAMPPRTEEEVRARFAAFAVPTMLQWADEELRRKIEADRGKALRELLPRVLTRSQIRRFRQVEWHAVGLGAFADREVEQALALTEEQKAKIRAVAQEPEGSASLQPGSAVASPEIVLQTRNVPHVLKILTEDQRRTWADLTGEPFNLRSANGDLLVEIRRAYMSRLQTPEVPPVLRNDAFQNTLRR